MWPFHNNDVIMSAMACQITSPTIAYSTVYSGADQIKHQSSASLALWGEFTGDRWIPPQRASNAESFFNLMTSSWVWLYQHVLYMWLSTRKQNVETAYQFYQGRKESRDILPHWYNLTHWGRDKMDATSQTTLSIAFSWMNMLEFRLNFHWSLFLRVQLTISQHWLR